MTQRLDKVKTDKVQAQIWNSSQMGSRPKIKINIVARTKNWTSTILVQSSDELKKQERKKVESMMQLESSETQQKVNFIEKDWRP